MARIRCIKPEFWTSQQIVECSPTARLLFIGLWNFADDRGVIPRRPRTIKMQVFPGDDFTAADIDGWLNELELQRLVGRFEHNREEYLVVTGWHHQKIERPTYKYPVPPGELNIGEDSARTRRGLGERSPPEGNGINGSGKEKKNPRPPLSGSTIDDRIEEEEEVQNLIKTLRADPYRVNDAVTAVQAATTSGCTVDEIRQIATQWALADKWSSAQLWTRISRAMPGECPTAHWPPPDAAKQQRSRRGTGDPETDAANREYLERERMRRDRQNQTRTQAQESLVVV